MRVWGVGAIALLGVLLAQVAHGQTAPAVLAPPVVAPPVVAPAKAAPVDINSASTAELIRVRFIGRNRAAAIVAGRPWRHPEDLVAKRVMPRKVYDQIKDHLVAR